MLNWEQKKYFATAGGGVGRRPETRRKQQFTEGMAGEGRQQALSGQVPGRTSTGAAFAGSAGVSPAANLWIVRNISE